MRRSVLLILCFCLTSAKGRVSFSVSNSKGLGFIHGEIVKLVFKTEKTGVRSFRSKLQALALPVGNRQMALPNFHRAQRSNGALGWQAVILPPGGREENDPLTPPPMQQGKLGMYSSDDLEDADELNERFRASGLKRQRLALKQDDHFGTIVRFEAVVEDIMPFHRQAWTVVAKERNLTVPNEYALRKAITMPIELALKRLMGWTLNRRESEMLALRKTEVFVEAYRTGNHTSREGVREWLLRLQSAGTPICLCSSIDRASLEHSLSQMGIRDIFQHLITVEDGFQTRKEMFLRAAVKLERPPQLCAVIECDPEGITAAHDITARCITILGEHTAWELQASDLTVRSLDELSIVNIRRLFSEVSEEPDLMLELEPEPETKPRSSRRGRGSDDADDPHVYVASR